MIDDVPVYRIGNMPFAGHFRTRCYNSAFEGR
jgi:hypothetical protein